MDITQDYIKILSRNFGFQPIFLEKDYYLTFLLYLIKDIKGIYFKGGTAINKILLDHPRLSEDIDFTCTRDVKEIGKEIIAAITKEKTFTKVEKGKDVDGFVRYIIHYRSLFENESFIYIDLNQRGKIILEPQSKEFKHFYNGIIPEFKINILNEKELVAEKVCATITRNAPRDYYDLYNLINSKHSIDLKIVRQKFRIDKKEFKTEMIFKSATKIYNRWEPDLWPLTKTKPSYKEVIDVLAKYFKYCQIKSAKRKNSIIG
ncbi:nucleotidyl transferase AbiEii/AbiGii toxin family protein [Candidatus Woesearchaeota archaeon]|nr:nucleotidyl transferase AbiEii/AbiGii toxin family protein [Candidatus Woesearchaeota archaeon]